MNPIVQACLEVSRAGYEESSLIQSPLRNKRLLHLGSWLLSKQYGKPIVLKFSPQGYKQQPKKLALLFGGGIDSYCMLHKALRDGYETAVVFVDYGQLCSHAEWCVFRKVCVAYDNRDRTDTVFGVLGDDVLNSVRTHSAKLSHYREEIELVRKSEEGKDFAFKDYVFPARNLVLAAIGTLYAPRVWIASTRTDAEVGAPDNTPRFFQEASTLFSELYGTDIKVTSPFLSISKGTVVQDYLSNGGTVESLKETFSCYTPVPFLRHCGTCLACFKRYELFSSLNVEADFAVHPKDGAYYEEFKAKTAPQKQIALSDEFEKGSDK